MKISELTALIEACGKHGVRRFENGPLIISFGEIPDAYEQSYLTEIKQDPNNSNRSVPFDTSKQGEVDRDEELERLRLSDPQAYEDMVETE